MTKTPKGATRKTTAKKRKSAGPKRDLHAEITAQLITAIEADPNEPQMPWRKASGRPLWMPENAHTGKGYNGINILSLWATAENKGYDVPVWGTFKQWQKEGCQVRKGEKAALVVFYKEFSVEPDPEDSNDDGKDTSVRHVARASYVFNAAQVDGYEMPSPPEDLGPIERIAKAEAFVKATGAKIKIGGERAYYSPSQDYIQMPDEGLFVGTDTMDRVEAWHAVELHELGHWTSHKSRCDRQLGKRFGDDAYAAEELVAEIFSAQMCAELRISQDVRPDHAQYLAHWLRIMKEDPKAIFAAAAKASQAVAHVKGLQPTPEGPQTKAATAPDSEPRRPAASERRFTDPKPGQGSGG